MNGKKIANIQFSRKRLCCVDFAKIRFWFSLRNLFFFLLFEFDFFGELPIGGNADTCFIGKEGVFFLVCKSCGFSAAKSSLPEIIAELRKKAHSVFLHTIPSTEHFSSPSGGTPNWVCICAWNVCVLSINPKKSSPRSLSLNSFLLFFTQLLVLLFMISLLHFEKKRKSFLFCVKKINKTIKP